MISDCSRVFHKLLWRELWNLLIKIRYFTLLFKSSLPSSTELSLRFSLLEEYSLKWSSYLSLFMSFSLEYILFKFCFKFIKFQKTVPTSGTYRAWATSAASCACWRTPTTRPLYCSTTSWRSRTCFRSTASTRRTWSSASCCSSRCSATTCRSCDSTSKTTAFSRTCICTSGSCRCLRRRWIWTSCAACGTWFCSTEFRFFTKLPLPSSVLLKKNY